MLKSLKHVVLKKYHNIDTSENLLHVCEYILIIATTRILYEHEVWHKSGIRIYWDPQSQIQNCSVKIVNEGICFLASVIKNK